MLLLALATENAELRAQLAEVQDQCVELAVDAGELHAEVEALRRKLAELEDMTARDYVESDVLEFEHLSTSRQKK